MTDEYTINIVEQKVTLEATSNDAVIVIPEGSGYAQWGYISGDITNQTDLQDAFDSKQDVLVVSDSSTIDFTFATPNLTASVIPSGINYGFTTGSIIFQGSEIGLTQDNDNLFWDDTNNRLGVGTATPTERVEVNGNVFLKSDSQKTIYGTGKDMSVYYDGTSGYIKTDEVAASDLHITCGAAKTLALGTPVTIDMQWAISSGRTSAANFPDWATLTTNTAEYRFDVNDYIDLNAQEVPHGWVEGGTANLHLHVATDAANSSGADRFAKFTVYVAYSGIGVAWAETSFTAELTIPNGTVANYPLYLDMGDLDLTGFTINTHVKIRVKRIAATGGTEYADHIFIHQVGAHVLVDTLGSRTEIEK